MDNLFRSIRVLDENSSVTKGISFFWTYLNSIVFLCSKCTIQRHIINLQPFLTSFVFFHAFTDCFHLKTMKLKCIWNELWKGSKLAWYHHFTHIACGKKLRGLWEKLDALRVKKWTISFEVSLFRTKTHLLQRDFIFLNIFEL